MYTTCTRLCQVASTLLVRAKGIHRYVVSWINSFLSNWKCRLLFQGSPKIFSPVAMGTPQGWPISPLLLIIYISPLHPPIPSTSKNLGCVWCVSVAS